MKENSKQLQETCNEQEKEIERLRSRNAYLESALWGIQNTMIWRISQKYYALVARVPLLKRMINIGKKIFAIPIKRVYLWLKRMRQVDEGSLNPYSAIEYLRPIAVVVDKRKYSHVDASHVSLITTIKNEEKNIEKFLQSIENQSANPGEVIIVDGGSTDNTGKLVKRYTTKSKLKITFIFGGEINISQGRNIAISASQYELVLCTDAGCMLRNDFVANMVGAFQNSIDADLVGGTYVAQEGNMYAKFFIPDFRTFTEWNTLLPSGRAVLIKKDIWKKIGGFPEFLTNAGEDTLFDVMYRRESRKWVFSLSSEVQWNAPDSLAKAKALFRRYGKGEGESGLGDFHYYCPLINNPKKSRMRLDLWEKEGFAGYKEGRSNRACIDIERRKTPGVIFMLAGVPFTDSGCGQRCAQLTKEYIRQGYRVIYVSLYPSYDDLKKQYVDIDLTLLELYNIDDVPWLDV
jgi:glycosyltransferase involved in cell wall biosynthesis